MRTCKKMWIVSYVGAALVFFAWAPRADACYMSPVLDAAESSFSAFLADFNRWDAKLNYQPLAALAATPSQDQSNMVLVLWWLWMNGYGRSTDAVGTTVFSLSSFSPPLAPGEQPPVDLSSGGSTLSLSPLGDNPPPPPTPPIGIVGDGPSGTPSGGGGNGTPGRNVPPAFAVMPEPSTLTLLGLGVAGLAGYGWRRRNAQD